MLVKTHNDIINEHPLRWEKNQNKYTDSNKVVLTNFFKLSEEDIECYNAIY